MTPFHDDSQECFCRTCRNLAIEAVRLRDERYRLWREQRRARLLRERKRRRAVMAQEGCTSRE